MPIAPHDPEEFDRPLSQQSMIVRAAEVQHARAQKIVRVVTSFVVGQGAIQILNGLAGFFLVHRLSVEAYAQFGLATGFQNLFSILMDFGFASTIVPLVGARRDEPALVGRYVRAAKHLRDRSFWLLAPIASIAFLAIVHKHHWSWMAQAALLASVLLSLYSGGTVSYFSAPLFLFGRLKEYYAPQAASGFVRVVAYFVVSSLGGLTAWTAAGLSALAITANGIFIRKASEPYLTWPEKEDPATDKELLQYIYPATPAIIFSAFQSQISLFLVSIFGGSLYTAQVMALSRIGILFTALMMFTTMVIEPYVARHSRKGLLAVFAGFVLSASVACLPVVLIGYFRQDWVILLLGAKYVGVKPVMGLYMLSASLSFVAGVLWIMNRARKWVFWSGSILEVGLVLGVQVLFVSLIGVRTTAAAVRFNMASACCVMCAHLYVTVYGFLKDRRNRSEEATPMTNLVPEQK